MCSVASVSVIRRGMLRSSLPLSIYVYFKVSMANESDMQELPIVFLPKLPWTALS